MHNHFKSRYTIIKNPCTKCIKSVMINVDPRSIWGKCIRSMTFFHLNILKVVHFNMHWFWNVKAKWNSSVCNISVSPTGVNIYFLSSVHIKHAEFLKKKVNRFP